MTIRMEVLIVLMVYFVRPELSIHFDVAVASLLRCFNFPYPLQVDESNQLLT